MRVNSTANGAAANGNGAVPPQTGMVAAPVMPQIHREPFDKSVILRQSPIWSRMLLWSIVGVTTFSIGWACLATIDRSRSSSR